MTTRQMDIEIGSGDTSPSVGASGPGDDFLTLGPVELRVTDVARATDFWQRLIGLVPMGEQDGAVALGSADRPLVLLRETAGRPAAAGFAGLYHLAVHYPTRHEFGRVLGRLMSAREPISPVDHLFSQAIYLRDPDGIGVELTLETPWRMREVRVDDRHGLHAIDQEGRVRRPSEPLDLQPLLEGIEAPELDAPANGAYIGHVHMSVPDLVTAAAFYRDQIGMIEHVNEPRIGLADLYAGGVFPHRIALNTFNGPGITPAPTEMAGMDRYSIRFDTEERLEETVARLERANVAISAGDLGEVEVVDPAGDAIRLTV